MISQLYLTSTLPPPPHFITKPSPWTPPLPMIIPLSKLTSSKLFAQPRGFGATTISNKRQQSLEDTGSSSNGGGEEDDDEDAIPQEVFDRMLGRIVFSVGVPMTSGIGMLYLMSSLKDSGVWEAPGWLPFLTVLLCFGTSALGIAYGTLSASWDPKKEGSALGWEEAQKNWPELWKEEEEGKRR